MTRRTVGLALVAVALLSACSLEPEQMPVSITGLVTEDGNPVQGATVELYRPASNGLPELGGTTSTGADGRYSLSTIVPEPRCFLVSVEVEVAAPGGGVAHSDRGSAASCGANVIDFAFTN